MFSVRTWDDEIGVVDVCNLYSGQLIERPQITHRTNTQSLARHNFYFSLFLCVCLKFYAVSTWTHSLRILNPWRRQRPLIAQGRRWGSHTQLPSPERAGPRKSTTSSSKHFNCQFFSSSFYYFSLISLSILSLNLVFAFKKRFDYFQGIAVPNLLWFWCWHVVLLLI